MLNVMIIEDDEQLRKMLQIMIEKEGYSVEVASNGEEAIKLFKTQPSELIITDLLMPEKDGLETIMEVKRDNPHVKIIAVSGGGQVGSKTYLKVAERLGAQHIFSKPFKRTDLLEAVASLIGSPS